MNTPRSRQSECLVICRRTIVVPLLGAVLLLSASASQAGEESVFENDFESGSFCASWSAVSNPEACGNGIDDDCDTLLDCADGGCDLDPLCDDCPELDAACENDGDCCAGTLCGSGVCLAPCMDLGQACEDPTDCCSNTCTGGVCVLSSCQDLGQSCGNDGDCCSGACDAGVCVLSSCQEPGQSCNANGDCCSGTLCEGGVCVPSPG